MEHSTHFKQHFKHFLCSSTLVLTIVFSQKYTSNSASKECASIQATFQKKLYKGLRRYSHLHYWLLSTVDIVFCIVYILCWTWIVNLSLRKLWQIHCTFAINMQIYPGDRNIFTLSHVKITTVNVVVYTCKYIYIYMGLNYWLTI